MTAANSTHLYEMMARLGIEPGVLPQTHLRYAAARCEACRFKRACQNCYAPVMLNFAPDFCPNADMLFDMRYEQT